MIGLPAKKTIEMPAGGFAETPGWQFLFEKRFLYWKSEALCDILEQEERGDVYGLFVLSGEAAAAVAG